MYKDNTDIQQLASLKTLKDVKDWVEIAYPRWIVGTAKRFSDDYPHLTCSWVEMCKTLKVKPAEILLVSYLPHKEDTERQILNAVCDIFSRSGFVIRRAHEFQQCTICESLLPSQQVWNKLTVKPPFEWKNCCRMCEKSA